MSDRSRSRHRRVDSEAIAPSRRQRGLAMGAGMLIAGTALTGAGSVTAPPAAASAPVVHVQDVALTADIPAYITDLQGLLATVGLDETSLGTALNWVGVDPTTTVEGAVLGPLLAPLLAPLLGDYGNSTLNSLTAGLIPDMTVGGLLGSVGLTGTTTLDEVLIGLSNIGGVLGFDVGGVTIDDLETWLGFAVDPSALTTLGLTDSSTLTEIVDSATVGAALDLSGPLGAESLGQLLGVSGDSTTLTDMALGWFNLSGAQTVSEALASLLIGTGGTPLITAVGDLVGINGLDAATTLNDLLTDIGNLLSG